MTTDTASGDDGIPRPDTLGAVPDAPAPIVAWQAETSPSAIAPTAGLGRWVVWLLGANMVLAVVAGLQAIQGSALLASFIEGRATIDDIEAWESAFGVVGLVESGAFIVTAIAFLAWLRRAVANAPRLGLRTPVVSPNWAVGWWFIPFANLWKPFQAVRDLYVVHAPTGTSGSGIVAVWWLAYLAMGLVAQVAGRVWAAESMDTFEELTAGLNLWLLSEVVTVPAAVLAIIIVRRISGWAVMHERALATGTSTVVPDAAPDASAAAAPDVAPDAAPDVAPFA